MVIYYIMLEITFNYEDKNGTSYINISSDELIITDEVKKSINNIKQEIKKFKHIIENDYIIEYSIKIEEHKIKKQNDEED